MRAGSRYYRFSSTHHQFRNTVKIWLGVCEEGESLPWYMIWTCLASTRCRHKYDFVVMVDSKVRVGLVGELLVSEICRSSSQFISLCSSETKMLMRMQFAYSCSC